MSRIVIEEEARMSWPTEEQFDKAHQHGTEYALAQRANGATEAREAPLSGEWAGDVSPSQIARNVGWDPASADSSVDELADAWERGYFDTWAHSE